MIRRPPRSTQSRSSAASDVYKRQVVDVTLLKMIDVEVPAIQPKPHIPDVQWILGGFVLSLIHISEPTRPY